MLTPTKAPIPVGIPHIAAAKTTLIDETPLFLSGRAKAKPSGISWNINTIVKEIPNAVDASYPEPIANPSGKWCAAIDANIIIPVPNKPLLPLLIALGLYFIFSCIYIANITPEKMPNKTGKKFDISNAFGNKSKQTTATIKPAENSKTKLIILLLALLKNSANIPPIAVPTTPADIPTKVIFNICSNSFPSKHPYKKNIL